MENKYHEEYRFKYLNAPKLNLDRPVDISLELSSFCNQWCGYCLDPETPVLMADLSWKKIKDVNEGDQIVAFDEYPNDDGSPRKMRLSIVEKKWKTNKESVKIITDKGSFICSTDHKFLDISSRWTEAKNLSVGQKIKFAHEVWDNEFDSDEYKSGYLRGITDGDASARWEPLPGNTGKEDDSRRQVWWRLAITDLEPLNKTINFLNHFGIKNNGIKDFDPGEAGYKGNLPIKKIEIRSRESLKALENIVFNSNEESLNFARGYLAGIFDSEGSHSHNILRISQKKENNVVDNVIRYGDELGFNFVSEQNGARLLGNKWDRLHFLGCVGASIPRHKNQYIESKASHSNATIISIEEIGKTDLIDIQTSARTFYAAGFPTHNCYHADKKNLPFKQNFMLPETFKKIVHDAAELGVMSVKTNWRGESTMNPWFPAMTALTKKLGFIDRITNSNFKFRGKNRADILLGLCNQTKVKVSFDSFKKHVFEYQRAGGDHDLTLSNIDAFYNYPGRNNILVIQAVRTNLNKDEDIEGEVKRRWPSALVSIRDMVEGRVNKDIDELKHKERDYSERQSCIQAHARLIFDTYGVATVCCPDIKQELRLGSINDMTISEIWNSDPAKKLREDLLSLKAFENSPCKNCSSFETFKGYKPSHDS